MTQSPCKYSSRYLPPLASEIQESNSACAICAGSPLQERSQPVSLRLPCSQPLCSPGGKGGSDTEVRQATLYRRHCWLDHPFTCTPWVMVHRKRFCLLMHFRYRCSYFFFIFFYISTRYLHNYKTPLSSERRRVRLHGSKLKKKMLLKRGEKKVSWTFSILFL